MEDIKAGTIVQLKSGGPNMTVEFIKDGIATCQWFVNKKLEHGSFPITSIQIPPPPSIMVY